MAIFDKELNHLDPQDAAGSLRTLENYISYMRERLEFNNSNLTRTLSSAGTSTAEMVLIVAALQNNMQAMQWQITTLETTVSGLNNSIQTLSQNVTALQSSVGTLQSDVATLKTTVQNIDKRVTALEAKGGTT